MKVKKNTSNYRKLKGIIFFNNLIFYFVCKSWHIDYKLTVSANFWFCWLKNRKLVCNSCLVLFDILRMTNSWCLIGGTHSPVQRVGNAWCIPFPRVLPNGASGIRTPDIRILRSWSQDLTARPQSPHAFYYLSPSKIHVSLSPAILFFVVTEVIIDYLHFRFRLIK